MVDFGVQSLGLQDTFLKRRLSFAAFVVDEVQVSRTVTASADDRIEDNGEWDSERSAGLDDDERVVAKRRIHDFQGSCRAKKYKFYGAVTELFQLDIKLVNQDASVDAGLLTELLSAKGALATAQAEERRTHYRVAPLHQKHRTIVGDLHEIFDEIEAGHEKAVTGENTHDKIRLWNLKKIQLFERAGCS